MEKSELIAAIREVADETHTAYLLEADMVQSWILQHVEEAFQRLATKLEGDEHECQPFDGTEVRISLCQFGCKVWKCRVCSAERVIHMKSYGCPQGI